MSWGFIAQLLVPVLIRVVNHLGEEALRKVRQECSACLLEKHEQSRSNTTPP